MSYLLINFFLVTVYFISGLGADKRAFQKLELPENLLIKYIEWIDNSENESLSNYCLRLCNQIYTAEPFTLIGLSFGGIVAVELSKILQPAQIILISSVSTSAQLPMSRLGHSLIKTLHLYKCIPSFIFKNVNAVTYWLFGVKKKDEKKLLTQIITDTPSLFAKWAMGKILTWENTSRPKNLFHIHGTADKLFPIKNITADVRINDGGHFMVYSKAEEISKILRERLTTQQ
jgi:pimeloyl-ACP methyl ester carboxylesterase